MTGTSKSDYSKEIGTRIGRLRIQRGWSQEKLGQEANIKAAQISKIELGDALPKITTITAICEALNCSYDDVLPASPGMKTAVRTQIIELDNVLAKLPAQQQDQIITTALAAALYYVVQGQ